MYNLPERHDPDYWQSIAERERDELQYREDHADDEAEVLRDMAADDDWGAAVAGANEYAKARAEASIPAMKREIEALARIYGRKR